VRLAGIFVIICAFVNAVNFVPLSYISKSFIVVSTCVFSFAYAETVTILDWQPWESLPDSEKRSIAPYCPGGFVAPAQAAPIDSGSTQFLFNESTTDQYKNSTFNGDVQIRSNELTAFADEAVYSGIASNGSLTGNVILRVPGVALSGESADISLENYYALLKNAQFVMHGQDLRGTASQIERPDAKTLIAKKLSFTRCAPSSNAWQLKSSKLTIDNDKGVVTAWNSRIEVQNIPIIPIPYISFPLNGQARTGFLIPTLGSSTSVPYYVHLAPNYDDTFTPVYSATNGVLLRNEFRFLTESHNGINEFDYQVLKPNVEELVEPETVDPDARWSLSHKQSGRLTSSIGYDFSTRWVSDQNFDPTFNAGADKTTEQVVSLTLKQSIAGFTNSAAFAYKQPVIDSDEKFKTFDTTIKSAKGKLSSQLLYQTQSAFDLTEKPVTASEFELIKQPELTLNYKPNPLPLGLVTSEQFKYSFHTRDLPPSQIDTLLATELDLATTTHRFHGSSSLSRPFKNSWGYFTPTVEGLVTSYDLDNELDFSLKAEYGADNFNQLNWRASLDQGLTLNASGNTFAHTLKPRLYYAYAPLVEHDAPLLDSEIDTSFKLFTNSRFSSVDRVGDMSRLSTSLSYDLSGLASKRTLLSLSAQKGIKLSQERLLESGTDAIDNDWQPEYSDWIGTASINPNEYVSLSGAVNVAHDWDAINSFTVTANYKPTDRIFGNLSAVKNTDGHTLSGGAYFPIRPNIALIGYASAETDLQQPDWSDFQVKKLLYGIDYDNCCWSFRIAVLETPADDDESASLYPLTVSRSPYFEITLKGIGAGFGTIDDILERLKFGYSGRLFNYR